MVAMKWFGTDWGAPVCRDEQHVPTPVGIGCYVCGKPIGAHDRGLVFPFHGEPTDPPELSTHLRCFGRSVGLDLPRPEHVPPRNEHER